mgnify:CR=1 FL=1
MAAKREEVKLNDGWKNIPATNMRLVRQASGAWAFKGDIELTPYTLNDGRVLHFVPAQITVHARQHGSRPRPDPFGHKAKRKRATKG